MFIDVKLAKELNSVAVELMAQPDLMVGTNTVGSVVELGVGRYPKYCGTDELLSCGYCTCGIHLLAGGFTYWPNS